MDEIHFTNMCLRKLLKQLKVRSLWKGMVTIVQYSKSLQTHHKDVFTDFWF